MCDFHQKVTRLCKDKSSQTKDKANETHDQPSNKTMQKGIHTLDIGIMEKKMETTIIYWGNIGLMENKMIYYPKPLNPKPTKMPRYWQMQLEAAIPACIEEDRTG